jgi:elongation factor 3
VRADVIHYESFKLKRYKGNLSQFVKRKPEAAAYYDIKMTQQQWRFPEPGFLEGVKSKDKAILKMMHTGYTYPGTTRKVVHDASIFCSLSSRVAVVGANGAGKSTMIKMLIGELIPSEGTVWKHPNLRIAYVAQHAFHHLEKHLDDTPSEYIQWRFATGEDRENLDLANRQLTAEVSRSARGERAAGGGGGSAARG